MAVKRVSGHMNTQPFFFHYYLREDATIPAGRMHIVVEVSDVVTGHTYIHAYIHTVKLIYKYTCIHTYMHTHICMSIYQPYAYCGRCVGFCC